MTRTNDPPLVASVALIPDSNEKADLDAPSDESGKLVVGQVPNISISETIVVADQAERLSLEVQEGDVAIQQDTTESFIFTGGANVEINWQLVQFDAVGGIAGEDIAPRDIDGRNVTITNLSVNGLLNGADTSAAAAGEALTSDGTGGFGFSPVGSAAITRNGNEIEYVSLDTANLPTASDTGDVALVTETNEYVEDITFTQGFNIETATFSKSINTQDDLSKGIAWNNDGTRLYEVGFRGKAIYQYSVSTPFDIASASFSKSINTQDASPNGIAWNNDGSRLYEIGGDSDKIYQSSLSTSFDIASASFSKSINTQDLSPGGIAWNNDGTRLYEVGFNGDKIYQSSLSTPFDIASASFQKSINTQDSNPSGIEFDANGTRLYEVGSSNDKIFQFNLSTPFDIASASFSKSINLEDSSPEGIAFNDDGSRLYEVGSSNDKIYQSDLTLQTLTEWVKLS